MSYDAFAVTTFNEVLPIRSCAVGTADAALFPEAPERVVGQVIPVLIGTWTNVRAIAQ